MRGEGLVGGARRKRSTRKKPVPQGLKKWHAFRKKHPDLSIKQQSRLYKKQGLKKTTKKKRKKKGRGFDEDDEEYEDEEEFQGFGMLGGAEPSGISAKSTAWQTKNVKDINKYEKVGEGVMKMYRKYFPKRFNVHKKAVGAGIDQLDYVRFAKSDAQKGVFGQKLRTNWNTLFADVLDSTKSSAERGTAGEDWLDPRENLLVQIGFSVIDSVDKEDAVKAYLLNEK